ncbi:MAG: GNAT family N-acetyltransferase [Candidatus Babeliales bacterium]
MKRLFFSLIMLGAIFVACATGQEQYSFALVKGDAVEQIFPLYRYLYLVEYQEYPYLYKGNAQEVEEYITFLKDQPDTVVAIVYYNDEPVGFACATSFLNFDKHFEGSAQVFKDAGLQPEDYFYGADVFIQKEHQGNFLSKKLLQALEEHAQQSGYNKICFIYESYDEHPSKPSDFVDPEPVYQRLGYIKTDLATKFTWNTILPDGTTNDREHVLTYWVKNIE